MSIVSQTLRSDFLIHWTGKDINSDYRTLTDEQRQQYVSRLRDTVRNETNGLWMTKNKEEIIIPEMGMLGYGDTPMTCFTEIKLSNIQEHTMHYGCLGVGFNRQFVIDLFGSPVQYVSGTRQDKVTMKLIEISDILTRLSDSNKDNVDIKTEEGDLSYNIKLDAGHRAVFKELHKHLKPFVLLLKPMSDVPGDYRNFNESEWRVLYYANEQEKVTFLEKDNTPVAKITFEPAELKILILPDDLTRQMALKDSVIIDWFGNPLDLPIIVTVEECLQF